jgi:hypothetical protein
MNPELTHLALALLAIARGIRQGVQKGFARWANKLRTGTTSTRRILQ